MVAGLYRTVSAVRDNSVTIAKIAFSQLLSIPVLGPWHIKLPQGCLDGVLNLLLNNGYGFILQCQ
ncbi:hypothetical protein ES705_36402 [subsurface metagenome]